MEVKWIDDKKMSIEDLVGVSKHVSSIGIQTLDLSWKISGERHPLSEMI